MASIEKVKQYRFFAKAANMRFSAYRTAVFETIVRGSPPREFEVAIQAVRNKGKRSPAAAAAGTAGERHLTAQTAAALDFSRPRWCGEDIQQITQSGPSGGPLGVSDRSVRRERAD